MTRNLTPYSDVNEVLERLSDGLASLLGDQLVGLYLTGSLTYGGFEPGSSDIDFLAVLKSELTEDQLEQITKLHQDIATAMPKWAKRLEGSYITVAMIADTKKPDEKRPYVNGGTVKLYKYGNEWIINLYALQESGVSLIGPPPKEVFPRVGIEEVRAASKQDLEDDWLSKLDNSTALRSDDYDTNHIKAYCVLTMCRILHRAKNNDIASKRVASNWVKETYGDRWENLVTQAENWQHGMTMPSDEVVEDFIRFTANELDIPT